MINLEIYGMRRSGNHIIIEWLMSHFKYSIHINDINDLYEPNIWFMENNKIIKLGKTYDWEPLIPKKTEIIIKSYEDIKPQKLNNNTIIILRDWYNICSSKLVSNRQVFNCKKLDCSYVYLELCKLYKDYSNNFILYNRLINDVKYQKNIEKKLNLSHIKLSTEFPLSKIGKGSSFDKKLEINKLNYRYKNIINTNEWKKIISYNEINKYMKDIFNINIYEI